jgi:hypothetical protein
VLVCYLDDSGKNPQSRITTLAGFVADQEQWALFETAVEPLFGEYKVRILHAKEMENTKGDFAQWPVIRKQSFVSKLGRAMTPRVPLGVSMSALKDTYADRARESDRKRAITAYSFCFNAILDWILRDVRVGRLANTEGLSFILESGHENNAEAEQCFNNVRKQHNLENILGSIRFAGKESCRAIQMADLLAFYSRRHGAALEQGRAYDVADLTQQMMNIINGCVPIRAFVATDFENKAEPLYGDTPSG